MWATYTQIQVGESPGTGIWATLWQMSQDVTEWLCFGGGGGDGVGGKEEILV